MREVKAPEEEREKRQLCRSCPQCFAIGFAPRLPQKAGGLTLNRSSSLSFSFRPASPINLRRRRREKGAGEKSREGRDPRGAGTDSARQKVVVSAEELWTGIPLNYSLHYLTRLKSFRIIFQNAIGLALEQQKLRIPAPLLAPHRADGGSKA